MKQFFKYLSKICKKDEKIILVFTGLLAIIAATFEAINISALIPLINSIISPNQNIFANNQYLVFLNELFSKNSIINYIIIFSLIFFIKIIYLLAFNWFVLNFLKKVERRVVTKLFRIYINQSLNFFYTKKVSEILRNLTNEIGIFRGSLKDAIDLFVEITLIIFILSLLFVISFKATFVIVILVGISSLLYIQATKKKIAKWAKERILYLNRYYQNVMQTFRLITEIKIFNVGEMFLERNTKNIRNLTNIVHYRTFIKILPKLLLESIGVIFFVLIIFILINSDANVNSILVTLGIFLASSIRIISSSNKLLIIYQNIKNSIPSLKLMTNELSLIEINKDNNINLLKLKRNIELKNVYFSYKDKETEIFTDLNLEIKKNSFIGIFGKSGQGKSTLIRIISSLIKPDNGDLFVDGKRVEEKNFLNMSIIPQESNFFEGSIKENITFTDNEELINKDRLKKSLEITNLKENVFLKNKISIDTELNDELKNFSGGQLQRIALSRAIYKNSDLLILDEATSALDESSENEIVKLLNRLKKETTIILISHNHSNFQNCDIVYEIKDKKITRYDK